jgi:hypothetical protein
VPTWQEKRSERTLRRSRGAPKKTRSERTLRRSGVSLDAEEGRGEDDGPLRICSRGKDELLPLLQILRFVLQK